MAEPSWHLRQPRGAAPLPLMAPEALLPPPPFAAAPAAPGPEVPVVLAADTRLLVTGVLAALGVLAGA